MSDKKHECPQTEELRELVYGGLSDSRQEECTEHMNECPCCQAKIEEIATGGADLTSDLRASQVETPDATSAYWPALRAASDASREVAVARPRTRKELEFSFLQPPTDAAYLGRLGHFDVMRVLGRGGMGVVLEAFDTKLQRNVALKVLDPDLADDENAKLRFCREARAAAAVTHENVVAVHQVERSVDGGPAYLVMQLVSGDTLEQRLLRDKRLPAKEIVRIGMEAARGLAAAHAQGLIHRDVKPGNILLEPPHDRVKLTDFGLARVNEDVKLTRTGFVSGTPLYMAPEQALGAEPDPRSDLFSLGAVLYEAATGTPPFTGNSALAILKQITEVKHKPIRELNPAIPEWLAETIEELLAKKPQDRYQTAADLAEVLEYHWAHIKTSSDELPGVCLVELAAQARRRKIIALVGGLALLAAGIVGGMFLPRTGGKEVSSAEPVAVLNANAGTVWSVSFDPANDSVAMGIEVGSVRVYDVATKNVKATLDAHRGIVWHAIFADDGRYLATAGDDGRLKLWNLSKSEPIQVFDHPNAVRGLAVARDGSRLYSGDRNGGLHIWSPGQTEPLAKAEQPGSVYAVAIASDGKTLATAGSDMIVRLWNAETLTQRMPLTGHAGSINGVAFNHDGSRLASVGWDKIVRIWDASSGQLKHSWDARSGDLWAVDFSPDGAQLATAGGEGSVKLWDAESGKLLATYLGHTTAVHAVKFSADGKRLVSGGRDGAARIWKLKD